MATVGAFEAKTHLSELLERVARGETITITKHGRTIAKLVPSSDEPAQLSRADLINEIRRFREVHGVRKTRVEDIKSYIEEGHRF